MPAATTNNLEGADGGVSAVALFDTAIGRCALAWRPNVVLAFALPAGDDAALIGQIRSCAPGGCERAPDSFAADVIAGVQALLSGEPDMLKHVPVDFGAVPPFERAVYQALREVGPGETVTYGELAARCGAPGAARAVGAAMGRNPVPVIVPCHRVLASGGRSGGFSAPGGVSTKFRILQIEQAGKGGSGLFHDLPLAVRPGSGAD